MTVLVGSRHEGYGETGMAHLLEHMLFKGSKLYPEVNDIDRALQAHGATNANATTWIDRTNYYETMPATDDNLEFGIELEADRLVNSFIRREDLLKEMTVVRNEFEMGENNPAYILSQRMTAVAYEWHNYGKSTIGNRSDIERVPIERLHELLQEVLPARQHRPHRRRQIRRGQGDRVHQQIFRHPARRRNASCRRLTPRSRAQDGERVVDPAPRRQGCRRRGCLSRSRRRAPGQRGHGGARLDSGRASVGPAVQGAGREKKATDRQRRGLRLA